MCLCVSVCVWLCVCVWDMDVEICVGVLQQSTLVVCYDRECSDIRLFITKPLSLACCDIHLEGYGEVRALGEKMS